MAAQIVMIIGITAFAIASLSSHGKTTVRNFYWELFRLATLVAVLFWGGFFSCFKG